jgi:hypothetical protein
MRHISTCDGDIGRGRGVLLQRQDAVSASRRQPFPQKDPRPGLVAANATGTVTPLNDPYPRCGVAAVPRHINAASARQGERVVGTARRFVVSLAGHVTLPRPDPTHA